ncbi:MAG: SLC13 family permease [Candidatus Omnitrophica bacterium]|nr:SLC13 family permease [Candidatus Omnitrophota bacterium]
MKRIAGKLLLQLLLSLFAGFVGYKIGLNFSQSLSLGVFALSILGTVFFWDFRLSFAFLGTSLLLLTRTIDLENLIKFSSLEVILFLVGMMVLIGFLKEAGFFAWLVSLILRRKKLTATKFLISISLISALLACAVDEVTSIIFMVVAILEICDYFEVNPVPFIISSVLATNIGSSGTVLGNPIGILIAAKSGLTFEDFLFKAFPVMLVCLVLSIFVTSFWYRNSLKELDKKIEELGMNEILIRLISLPPEKTLKFALGIFVITLGFISLHHRLEVIWGLAPNTVLLIVPLISSGLVMFWRWRKARTYIEKDVEWWTLLFFLMLFAQSGTLKYSGATDIFAQRISALVGDNLVFLTGFLLWLSCFGSSILDNVVLVSAFIPVVQGFASLGFSLQPLWWALLFGGCYGGNITLVGSTANIVALGLLEKEKRIRIKFFQWLGIGLVVGMVTTALAWVYLAFTNPRM